MVRYRLRKRKPFYKWLLFWYLFFLTILGIELFYIVFFLPYFQVREVVTEGTERVSSEEVRELVRDQLARSFLFFETKSIFLINLNQIAEALFENFPRLTQVSWQRDFPDRLVLTVKERRAKAISCLSRDDELLSEEAEAPPLPSEQRGEKCFFIDNKGVAFEEAGSEEEGGYIVIRLMAQDNFSLGKTILEEERLKRYLEIERVLEQELDLSLQEVSQESEEKLIAKTSETWELYLDSKQDLREQLANLELVLEKELTPEKRRGLAYIDLRFGSRIYYKFR